MIVKIGMNPVKLAALIRYHLNDLGARNAHHEFEHLARYVSKARIASNILPATGPVSSGGDRGRDFETFNSKHVAPGPPGNHFVANSTGSKKLVFACSLEKSIVSKINADMRTLLEQNGIEEVAYFCEANLPVAKRLKLIENWEMEGLTLEIFDGNAISELLAEPDLFWIAQEYLHLPSEVAPAGELEEGYIGHKQKWQLRGVLPISRSDFFEIKAGLRKATFDDSARADLNFWLEKMSAFLTSPATRDLIRDAAYETAVANLRGKGDLTPVANLIENYFSDVSKYVSIGEITDAVVLLSYSFGAHALEQYCVDPAKLFARRKMLEDLVDACLAQPNIGPGRRGGLLNTRGSLEFTPAELGEKPDITRVFEFWNEMLDHAAAAPLFPIEQFVDNLTKLIGHLGDLDALIEIASRAEELLAQRAGYTAAGEKAIDRALSLLERDEPAAAIRELQKAKLKWFSNEHLESTLRILLLLSEQYGRLGLAYASKYYALVAAYIAQYEDPKSVGSTLPEALIALADAENVAGNSFGYLQLFPAVLATHVVHDPTPLDMQEHPQIQEHMGQLAALLGYLKRGNPHARKHIDEFTNNWPPELKDPIWQGADQRSGFWNKGTMEEVWKGLEVAMFDRPYGDLGSVRIVSWSALGIDWRCEFSNDYMTTPNTEQFIAELQLAACSLSGRDLGTVPCAITLKLGCSSRVKKLEFAFSEQCDCEFTISLPTENRSAKDAMDSIPLLGAVLHSCSVLQDDALVAAFDKSLLESIFFGRPYAELYREFVPEELFAQDVRVRATAFEPDRGFVSKAGGRVPWFDGPGPTYDQAAALVDIDFRYKRIGVSLEHTLKNIKADEQLMARLRVLHGKGMKDWEILGILSNIAVNERLRTQSGLTPNEIRELGTKLVDKLEATGEVLPPELFSEEQLELHAKTYLMAFLNGHGLRQPLYAKHEDIERFFAARYKLREDDVEHPDFFGW